MELLKRYYTIDAYNWKLECFDVTTKSSCSGFPYKLNGSAPLMAADVDNEPSTKADIVKITDTKFYVQTDRNLYCFDAASGPLQLCSSGWPIAENSTLIAGRLGSNLQFSTPAYPYENPIGDVKGVCTYVSCFDFAGQIHDEWGASAYFKSKFNWTVAVKYLRGNARYPTTLGRSYLYGGCMINGQPTPVNCFDHYTNTTCSGFTPPNIPDPCAYGLYVHPSNPACLLYIADSGVLGTIDAYTGASGCLSSTSKESDVTDKGASTCSGRAPLSRRYSLEALAVNKGNVSGLLLTVLGSNGQPVVNWTGINVTVGKPIDMSSLSMALTGYTAQFKMTMVAPINGTPEVPFRMTYYAPGPELCLTVIPTINETMRIPILAQTINKGDNTTITAYNTTIDSHPC